MPSLVAWLDASSEEQRRMREVIRLFSDRESRDELGIGQIRDALSDMLFPGTSTLLTRARYLLFIPWVFRLAATKTDPARMADQYERAIIRPLKGSDDSDGLFGVDAGAALLRLPSGIYWSMLRYYRILTDPTLSRDDTLRLDGHAVGADDPDGPSSRRFHAWSPTLPPPPAGFPWEIPSGFALQHDEAAWLRDRFLEAAPDTLLAHLALTRPHAESTAAWNDAACLSAPDPARHLLDDARSFSAVVHGAQLLYNLILAEQYEDAGLDAVTAPVDRYRAELTAWAERLPGLADLDRWDLDSLLARIERSTSTPIRPGVRVFTERWLRLIREGDPATLADDSDARNLVIRRERANKGSQARVGNMKRLAGWGGGSGAGELVYRWPMVRRIMLDLHDGLERADDARDQDGIEARVPADA